MTDEQKNILSRINAYAEKVLGNVDPQKVQVSVQLEKLRPIMEEIAGEKNMSLEDFFILYMDLQSEASVSMQQQFQEEFEDLNVGSGNPLTFR